MLFFFGPWVVVNFEPQQLVNFVDWASFVCLAFSFCIRGPIILLEGIKFGLIKAVFVLASNHFQKCFSINVGVWLRMENKFSEKYF